MVSIGRVWNYEIPPDLPSTDCWVLGGQVGRGSQCSTAHNETNLGPTKRSDAELKPQTSPDTTLPPPLLLCSVITCTFVLNIFCCRFLTIQSENALGYKFFTTEFGKTLILLLMRVKQRNFQWLTKCSYAQFFFKWEVIGFLLQKVVREGP